MADKVSDEMFVYKGILDNDLRFWLPDLAQYVDKAKSILDERSSPEIDLQNPQDVEWVKRLREAISGIQYDWDQICKPVSKEEAIGE